MSANLSAFWGCRPFVSSHLAYLRRVSLLEDQREGAGVCYSLTHDAPLTPAIGTFLLEVLPRSEACQSDLAPLAKHKVPSRPKPTLVGGRPTWPRAA